MTIPFEKLKARLLANPKVKAEYDALAPELKITDPMQARGAESAIWSVLTSPPAQWRL
jgi:hypothetical protein